MTLHMHQRVVFSLDPSVMFLLLFSSLCSARAAPGEVARRHTRPCAHYTCINSIRKSSGQTFQSSAFNSSLGRLSREPGDFQGAWTCAFIPLFSLLIPTALLPYQPRPTCGRAAFLSILLRVPTRKNPLQLCLCTRAPTGLCSKTLPWLFWRVKQHYQLPKSVPVGQEERVLVG